MKGKWGWMGHTWRKPQEDITLHEGEVGLDGHTWRKPQEDITRQTLDRNPPGNRKRGRPKNTWKRSTLKDLQLINRTCTEAKLEAQNTVRWRKNVEALCSTGIGKD
jgi:hypothetical protein